MERFATLRPANDPHPWESRRVMAMVGLEEGSMEGNVSKTGCFDELKGNTSEEFLLMGYNKPDQLHF
jgi:hypothetical protein